MDLSASIKTDLLLGTIDRGRGTAITTRPCSSRRAARAFRFIASCISCPSANMFPGRHTVPFIGADCRRPGAGGFHARKRAGGVSPNDGPGDGRAAHLLRRHARRADPAVCSARREPARERDERRLVPALGGGATTSCENAIFRCVETRRPMVRAANTGVTCFVNRFGRVTQVLLDAKGSQFTEGVLTGTIEDPDQRRTDFLYSARRALRENLRRR